MQNSRTKPKLLLLTAWVGLGAVFLLLGCAPLAPLPDAGRPTGYERLEPARMGAARFEVFPYAVEPADVLPPVLVEGPHHRVTAARLDSTFLYTFTLESDLGEIEVVGRGLLRERIREIEALVAYDAREINGPELYAIELANAAGEPVETTLQLVRHPVRTFSHIPLGVASSYRAFGEMRKGGRTHTEDDYATELLGMSYHKRVWAERLGVDPYSTNALVQARLDRNGWLSFASSMTVRLATIPVPGAGASAALSAVGATSNIDGKLSDDAPEDVRLRNRAFLFDEISVAPAVGEEFLTHPWYSPTLQAELVRALESLDGVTHRHRFIEVAIGADDEAEARTFTRLARLLAETHARRVVLSEIDTARELVLARAADGRVVMPFDLDHLHWTSTVARAEAEVRRSLFERGDTAGLVLVMSGSTTAHANFELTSRGWEIVANREEAWLDEPLDPLAAAVIANGSARILPTFGGFGLPARAETGAGAERSAPPEQGPALSTALLPPAQSNESSAAQ